MINTLLWRWKAIDNKGVLKKGLILINRRVTLKDHLAEHQLLLISARRDWGRLFTRWSMSHKIELMKQIALLLQAGLTLTDGLSLIAEQHSRPHWVALLQDLKRQIVRGMPFAEALQTWPQIFPPLFVALIHTGELTGKLSDCCHQLAMQQEQRYLLHKRVHKALRYPILIGLVTILVSAGMLCFVLPEFAQIYQSFNTPLPPLTQAIITGAEQLTTLAVPGTLSATLIGTVFIFFRKRAPHWQIQEQRILLRVPFIAPLWRGHILSQIFAVLTMTQHAGIPLLEGIVAAEKTIPQPLWRQQINRIKQQIAEGMPFWQALGTSRCFTPLCRQLIRVGEESGELDLMLNRLTQWHTQQTLEQADNLTAMLEPLLILVVGGIIGLLVIGMYLPIFHLGDVMG